MKRILLVMMLLPILSFSQGKATLKYFISKDSLIGVKNQKGEIIIPAQFINVMGIKGGETVEIKNNTIFFDTSLANRDLVEKNSWGSVFDRKGNLLYQPYSYDNGADYFKEGVRRFVKNGKVGFVDRNAKVVIEPKYDFISPFNYGYASYCDGCDWEKIDDEHKVMVGGIWGVINFNGEIVQPVIKSESTVEIEGKYYPNPFKYNEREREILQYFEKQNKKLSDIYYVNFYNELSEKEKKLFFEIVEKPKEHFPFYLVNTYGYTRLGSVFSFEFLVSKEGKKVFTLGYNDEKVPFEKWLREEMKAAVEYQKKHPDNPNKLSK